MQPTSLSEDIDADEVEASSSSAVEVSAEAMRAAASPAAELSTSAGTSATKADGVSDDSASDPAVAAAAARPPRPASGTELASGCAATPMLRGDPLTGVWTALLATAACTPFADAGVADMLSSISGLVEARPSLPRSSHKGATPAELLL